MTRLFLILLLLSAPALGATVAARLDLDTLTDNAVLVVRGKIESKEARWDAAQTGIWTHHALKVSQTIKGDAQATLEFVTRGGVVGNRGQHVAGNGNFETGEEYVLFLWRDDDKRLQLVGMVQGALKVSEENAVTRARNSFAGLSLVDPKTLKALPEGERQPLDLEVGELARRVAERVKANEPAKAEGAK